MHTLIFFSIIGRVDYADNILICIPEHISLCISRFRQLAVSPGSLRSSCGKIQHALDDARSLSINTCWCVSEERGQEGRTSSCWSSCKGRFWVTSPLTSSPLNSQASSPLPAKTLAPILFLPTPVCSLWPLRRSTVHHLPAVFSSSWGHIHIIFSFPQ